MYNAHVQALSRERIRNYNQASYGNVKIALELYELNIQLSKHLYEYIGRFELYLRNQINIKLKDCIHERWYDQQWITQANLDSKIRDVKIQIRRSRTSIYINNGDVIAKLTMGFWKQLFNAIPFSILERDYHFNITTVFSTERDRLLIYKELGVVTGIRNRIAHHEPIMLKNRRISLDYIEDLLEISQKYYRQLPIDRAKIKLEFDPAVTDILDRLYLLRDTLKDRDREGVR